MSFKHFIFVILLISPLSILKADNSNNYSETEFGGEVKTIGGINYSFNSMALAEVEILMDSKNYHEAEIILNKIIKNTPDEYAALHQLGSVYFYLGEINKAEEKYKLALSYNPNLTGTLNSLGTIEVQRNNCSKAIPFFNKAIIIDNEFALSYLSRALCYHYLEETSLAISDYERVISLVPNSEIAQVSKSYLSMLRNEE